jgi:hypothetical protein
MTTFWDEDTEADNTEEDDMAAEEQEEAEEEKEEEEEDEQRAVKTKAEGDDRRRRGRSKNSVKETHKGELVTDEESEQGQQSMTLWKLVRKLRAEDDAEEDKHYMRLAASQSEPSSDEHDEISGAKEEDKAATYPFNPYVDDVAAQTRVR